jgi:DHA1 family bicyclomycin/chloramphenicol resistance-like MFS transporter
MPTAPSTQGTGAHSPWLIANVLAQISFGLLAMTLCLPSMQEWGAIFSSSQADVQLTFSGYVVAYGALQLMYGPLSDRHGRKPILMIGLVVAGLFHARATSFPLTKQDNERP